MSPDGSALVVVVPAPPAALALFPEAPPVPPAQAYVASLRSHHSRSTMATALRRAATHLGLPPAQWSTLPWHTLDPARLGALRTVLSGKYAPSTVNLTLDALQGVFRAAWRQGLLSEDAWKRLRDLGHVKGQRVRHGRSLSPTEQQALLVAAAAAPGYLGARNAALVLVLLGCGLRRGEAIALRASALQRTPGGGWLTVLGKGDKEARVPLPPGVLSALQRWIAVRGEDEGPLFPAMDRTGIGWHTRGLTERRLYKLLRAWAAKAGLGRVHPHDLRRTYITSILEAGHDLHTASRMARHAKVETTARYDMRGEQKLADVAAGLVLPTLP